MTTAAATVPGVNLPALRSHNAALVLDLLRTAGAEGISRLELAERTGLTPQAVSKITARLRNEGLAAQAGHRASTGGKPRTVLRLVPEAGHAVGVHLDRDEVRVVLVDLMGTVVGERRAPLDLGAGADAVIEGVAGEVEALLGWGQGRGGALLGGGPRKAEAPLGGGPGVSEVSRGQAEVVLGGRPGKCEVLLGDGAGASGVSREQAGVVPGGRSGRSEVLLGEGAGVSEVSDGQAGVVPGGRSGRSEVPLGDGAGASEVSRGQAEVLPAGWPGGSGALLRGGPGAVGESGGASGPGARGRALLGVGVALPGPLDHAQGVLHRVTGFPEWDGFPLRDALARRLGVPVAVDKDTNAAALGLAVGGEGGSFAYLHLGTGLGAGLVIGGVLHRGTRTGAGEFGHQVIQLDGPPCGCGDRGCIEALCLGAVARGDLDEAARVLGAGAANLVGLLDIDRVLLGGRTVAAEPERFVRGVATVLTGRARREGAERAVPVRVAPGGARGVAEGAAQLLLAPLFGRPE
ncbi:ROK family transcriptional regulator [Streptomyces sp. SID12488]|uniref:ROK family transcriptional regulator n=1 Tax=Streptomyces sp. SID12488 TaxID=2706040 RepID=UPI0013DA03FD|nr:ROK family transcriptional regulator [Streptomyces sp. SID12488]NEA61593.1 ROK family transcriptional regulator [Streptomyces sp. SID12488]